MKIFFLLRNHLQQASEIALMAYSISIQSPLVMRSGGTASYPLSSPVISLENTIRKGCGCNVPIGIRKMRRSCRAMVQQTLEGPSAAYAKEMERLSAKESLLLAVSLYLKIFSSLFVYFVLLIVFN